MTFGEKLAIEILDMPQTLNRPENIKRMMVIVEQAMQAQREADAIAAQGLTEEMLMYETELNYNERMGWRESMKKAILNAEVKI